MAHQNNWQLSMFLELEADEESEIADLLEIIASDIRNGSMGGDGNYCSGIYTFLIEELPIKGGE